MFPTYCKFLFFLSFDCSGQSVHIEPLQAEEQDRNRNGDQYRPERTSQNAAGIKQGLEVVQPHPVKQHQMVVNDYCNW